jgi:lipoate-protein ligase A
MDMQLLDITLPTLEENLALDEALLLEAEDGSTEVLRLWEWPSAAVVMGAASCLGEDVNEAACQRDGVPIQRRSSGGGTVLLGSGCLAFSLMLRYDRHPALAEIRPSYCYILGRLREALADIAPGLACAGTSDLALSGQKVSGNSQQRKRDHLLHHGTLLYAFALEDMNRYLHPPARQPEYRQQREHRQFVRNLPVSQTQIKNRLRAAWDANDVRSVWPRERVDELIAAKYALSAWIRRR